jgi:DnaJ family protein C protein 13
MFEKVNKAYEFLCSAAKIKDGPDPENIRLILRTQCILFKNHSDLLAPYKYAGYPMLIRTIQIETRDPQLFSKKNQLLTNSTELVYQTINCSALNAEELRREQGFELINEAFTRCVSMLSQFVKDTGASLNESETMSVQVCVFVTKCFSAAAQFELCRQKITSLSNLIKDLCRCLQFKNLTRLCLSTADAVSALAPDTNLQTALHDAGVLVHLLYYMFNYDFTLEEGGVERSSDSNQQEIDNNLASMCIKACARLAGFHNGFELALTAEEAAQQQQLSKQLPANEVMKSLIALLTPYLARNISQNSHEILKTLNSNTRNPYLLWDNATRAELRAYLENERESLYKKGECMDTNLGTLFKYSVLDKELVIGDIFVRIYNEMPSYSLENPKLFCVDLLDFLGSQAQYLYSVLANPNAAFNEQSKEKLKQAEMAIEALRNVIKHNDGVEIQCIGHFKLLFMLLRFNSSLIIQTLTLETLLIVTANKECVNDIANNGDVLVNLLLTLHSYTNGQQLAIDCLHALASNGKIVKDMVTTGGILYVLNIFCNGGNSTSNARQKCAELFAKLTSEKLTGPRIRLILIKFLPPLFMDAMKDNAEAAVLTFEGTYENPELIWNDEARQSVCSAIKSMSESLYKRQSEPNGSEVKWTILEDLQAAGVQNVTEASSTLYSSVSSANEIVVSGVYIRLFVANPGWVLRKPREFLADLFAAWSDVANKKTQEGERLELLTQALGNFSLPNLSIDCTIFFIIS